MSTKCLHGLFERQVRATPRAVALTCAGRSLCYAELDAHAEGVASALIAAKPATGFAGLCARRDEWTVISMLGVLKAGMAYVPFAAGLPGERVAQIAQRASIDVVVGSAPALAQTQLGGRRSIAVDELSPKDEPPRKTNVRPEDVAYVIFTSGSTGTPKGVVVLHEQIVNSTRARLDVFPRPCTAYLVLAPFTFDASAAGTYLTLATGGRLVIPTDSEVLDPQMLANLITREAITHLDGVPSQYAPLVAYYPEALSSVRVCILAGEALPSALVQRHLAIGLTPELYNEYGPTEGTVWSTVHLCGPADGAGFAPLGRPVRGVRVEVCDERLNRQPVGEIGEIMIAGANLARGYLGCPGLTADRFAPNPWPTLPGERLYRSGDLGSWDDAGVLHFHGRIDSQIKVRGYRVEPAEIEAALLTHPDVVAVAVIPRLTPTGTQLVAHVATRPTGAPSDGLDVLLRGRLPEYMVPAKWEFVTALPLTAHGKVDRRALSSNVNATVTAGATTPAAEDGREHLVVRSCGGDYSVWPATRPIPLGWHRTEARAAPRAECLAAIDSTWRGLDVAALSATRESAYDRKATP